MKSLKYSIIILIIFLTDSIIAQQIPIKSLYKYSRLSYNPAESGAKDYIPIYLTGRIQWVGIDDAPKTQNLLAHSKVGKTIGVGLNVYNETQGITERTGGSLNMSYHLSVSRETRISFGLSGIFTQYSFKKDEIVTQNPNDPLVLDNTLSQMILDVGFGMNFYGKNYQIGISGLNLVQPRKNIENSLITSSLDRIFFFDASTDIEAADNLKVIPSVLTKYMTNAPIQFDFNVRLMFNDFFWLGAGYRMSDAGIVEIGFNFNGLVLAYAYDYSTSDLNTINEGSHEALLGYQINVDRSTKKTPWRKRNRIFNFK